MSDTEGIGTPLGKRTALTPILSRGNGGIGTSRRQRCDLRPCELRGSREGRRTITAVVVVVNCVQKRGPLVDLSVRQD